MVGDRGNSHPCSVQLATTPPPLPCHFAPAAPAPTLPGPATDLLDVTGWAFGVLLRSGLVLWACAVCGCGAVCAGTVCGWRVVALGVRSSSAAAATSAQSDTYDGRAAPLDIADARRLSAASGAGAHRWPVQQRWPDYNSHLRCSGGCRRRLQAEVALLVRSGCRRRWRCRWSAWCARSARSAAGVLVAACSSPVAAAAAASLGALCPGNQLIA